MDHQYAARLPQNLIQNCQLLADRSEILPLIRKEATFCEVGVALGDFTASILSVCQPRKFYGIDLFGLHQAPQMWGGRVGQELNGMRHEDYYRQKFAKQIDQDIVEVLSGDSAKMLRKLREKSIDYFYIDAHHSYESVSAELELVRPLCTANAWIILNDYIMADWITHTKYGVIQAAHEFMIAHNWEMIYLALHTGMFCDVAIRRRVDGD
jgi:cephalosporin hydroxylase